jgi:hypothetical protein
MIIEIDKNHNANLDNSGIPLSKTKLMRYI